MCFSSLWGMARLSFFGFRSVHCKSRGSNLSLNPSKCDFVEFEFFGVRIRSRVGLARTLFNSHWDNREAAAWVRGGSRGRRWSRMEGHPTGPNFFFVQSDNYHSPAPPLPLLLLLLLQTGGFPSHDDRGLFTARKIEPFFFGGGFWGNRCHGNAFHFTPEPRRPIKPIDTFGSPFEAGTDFVFLHNVMWPTVCPLETISFSARSAKSQRS